MTGSITPIQAQTEVPIIFLLGPPGVGKSTLGRRACMKLQVKFLDLATTGGPEPANSDCASELERLTRIVADRAADVIELPWELQQERRTLALTRKLGVPLLLWAHPEEMQARSGRKERLFTPVPRLKIRGGFGRNGTGCREFRHLDRACENTLILVDLPFEESAELLEDCIADIREESNMSPTEREGLSGWVEGWREDHSTVSTRVIQVIVDAMARYLAHLRAQGTSPRKLSGIRSDLDAAGHLVLMYDAPKGKKVLVHFDPPPWEFEFKRKFTDSPTLVSRYRRNLEGFARYLKESGDIPNDS